MKIIIPMAGRGSRLRPHTLTVPKPLVPIAGKPIVQILVEDLTKGLDEKVDEIAFVTGDFGDDVDKQLIGIAESLGAKGSVYKQDLPLGTAHAILCAKESISGKCMIAFSDTLFKANFSFDSEEEGIIWAQKVEDPSAFGVLKTDENNVITDFIEKPKEFVSDLAIVGIYYVRDGDNLRKELQYLLDNDIKDRGEYQLTNALENMKQKGLKFKVGQIDEWLDCGNKDAVVYTNQRMLEIKSFSSENAENLQSENSVVIQPCYIGKNVKLMNSVVGPHVSIGDNSTVNNSVISNTVIQNESTVNAANLENSMIGNKVAYDGSKSEISIGDFSVYKV